MNIISGSTAAEGPATRGKVPTGLSELTTPGSGVPPIPNNDGPAHFLPAPSGLGCQPGRLSTAPAAIALTSWAWSRSFWSAYRWANWLIAAVKFVPFPM